MRLRKPAGGRFNITNDAYQLAINYIIYGLSHQTSLGMRLAHQTRPDNFSLSQAWSTI